MKLNKDKILKDKYERKAIVLSQDYLKQYNKCWIAQDDSGRIVSTNKNFDVVTMCDELQKKYGHRNFKVSYIDIKENV